MIGRRKKLQALRTKMAALRLETLAMPVGSMQRWENSIRLNELRSKVQKLRAAK